MRPGAAFPDANVLGVAICKVSGEDYGVGLACSCSLRHTESDLAHILVSGGEEAGRFILAALLGGAAHALSPLTATVTNHGFTPCVSG